MQKVVLVNSDEAEWMLGINIGSELSELGRSIVDVRCLVGLRRKIRLIFLRFNGKAGGLHVIVDSLRVVASFAALGAQGAATAPPS